MQCKIFGSVPTLPYSLLLSDTCTAGVKRRIRGLCSGECIGTVLNDRSFRSSSLSARTVRRTESTTSKAASPNFTMSTLESRATLGVNIAFLVLSWIAVSLRIFVRAGMLRNFGSDDWTMLITQLLFSAYLIAQLGGIVHGTGQHLVDLDPADAELALKFWYFCEIFYVCATSFLKVSIGLFLLRVATNKIHIWIVRLVMILAAVFGFAFFFVIVFQCWPISDWWSLDPNQKHCIKPEIVVGLTYGVSGLNVIADWTLGILPAFIVKDLQMSTRQKRLVAVILSFAAIGSSATIVRLPYVGSLSQSFDGSNGDFLCMCYRSAISPTHANLSSQYCWRGHMDHGRDR